MMDSESEPEPKETTSVAGRVQEIDKLRSIAERLPMTMVPVSDLAEAVGPGHVYWIDREGQELAPHQILRDWAAAKANAAWADHVASIEHADLTQPIWIYEDGTVFDGIHRLVRAVRDGVKKLPVRYFSQSDLPAES